MSEEAAEETRREDGLPRFVAAMRRFAKRLSIPVSMAAVEAGGNVLLPHRSLIHYELLAGRRVNDGERLIHHKATSTPLSPLLLSLLLPAARTQNPSACYTPGVDI